MEEQHLLDDLSPGNKIKRWKLLPWWIKVFVWIFLVFGILAMPLFIYGLLGYHYELSLYGLETNNPLSPIGLLLTAIFVLKGIVSYSLWYEKDWALTLGIIDAIAGILICILSMLLPLILDNGGVINYRLELLILIPYLIKLFNLRASWN